MLRSQAQASHGIAFWRLVYYTKRQIYHTPGNISVSSKHVLSHFDDGNRVIFPITLAVKRTGSPAVSGGAVTQHPVRVV